MTIKVNGVTMSEEQASAKVRAEIEKLPAAERARFVEDLRRQIDAQRTVRTDAAQVSGGEMVLANSPSDDNGHNPLMSKLLLDATLDGRSPKARIAHEVMLTDRASDRAERTLSAWANEEGPFAPTPATVVDAIQKTLDPLSLEEKREVLRDVATEFGITDADIERRRIQTLAERRSKLKARLERTQSDLAAANAIFQDELAEIYASFMAFCKAIRGFELGLEPGAHLMALGRIFIDVEKTSATELADLVQSLEEVTTIHPSCRRILADVIPNWDAGIAYLRSVLDGENSAFEMLFSRRWARAGYPVVEMGHKVAASLMFTHGSGEVTAPWPAFSVKIPDGLVSLEHSNAIAGATRVLCLASSELNSSWQLRADFRMLTGPAAGSEKPFYFPARSLDDAIVAQSEDGRTWPELNRALEMLCRMTAGACMLATAKQDIQEREWRPKPKAERRRTPGVEPPVGTRFIVAKNVELDLREQVHEYIRGKSRTGAKLTVQFVVRGHRRWQACGPKHAERKLIWINPYWKGPEEGRALLRGYEFKTGEKETPQP